MSIRIGILGYGNLGRGVECAIKHNPDLELVAVFTRRAPETVKILTETAAVYSVNDAEKMKDKIDVLIICGGSATDLPKQTPEYAKMFNVIDSFDTHARIPEHFDAVDAAAKGSGHIGMGRIPVHADAMVLQVHTDISLATRFGLVQYRSAMPRCRFAASAPVSWQGWY